MSSNNAKLGKKPKRFPALKQHKTGQWYIRRSQIGFHYLGQDKEAAEQEYERLKRDYETTGKYPQKKTLTQKGSRKKAGSASHNRTVLSLNSPSTIRSRESGVVRVKVGTTIASGLPH